MSSDQTSAGDEKKKVERDLDEHAPQRDEDGGVRRLGVEAALRNWLV